MPDLWSIERRLWIDGVEAYEQLMAKECIMVFGPMGIMHADEVIESMKDAPRWTDVNMSKRSEMVPAQAIAVLAYHARAQKENGVRYDAVCTSTYIEEDGHWRIAQHQQTPV